jgi:hypothetical protein
MLACDSAEIVDGSLANITRGGITGFWVASFPEDVELQAVVRFSGLEADFHEDADRSVEANLVGPGGGLLVALDFEIPAGRADPLHQPGWEATFTMRLEIEFTAEQEGGHMLEFYVGGRFADSLPLVVRLAESE